MRTYKAKITVKHDKGRTKLSFLVCVLEVDINYAQVTKQAIDTVMKVEGCPISAIVDVNIKLND